MSKTKRINVHLYELYDRFKERCTYGDITGYTRYLIHAFVEDRILILDEKTLKVIEEGDFDEAVNLITPALQRLREMRLQSGQSAQTARKKNKSAKGASRAGVKSPEEQKALELYEKMMKGLHKK